MLCYPQRVANGGLRGCLGIFPGGGDDVFSRNAANLGSVLGSVELDVLCQFIEALGPFFDIFPVIQVFLDHHVSERVEQRNIRANVDLQVTGSPFRQLDLARVDDDQLCAVAHGALHSQRDDRVGFCGVRSRDEQEIGTGQLLDGVRHGTLADHDRHTGDRWGVSGA